MNNYKINYRTLNEGKHSILFHIDSQMFNSVEESEIYGGSCDVHIEVTKKLSDLKLDITVNGSVTVECDRCLEEVSIPVHFEGVLFVKITEQTRESEFIVDDKVEDTLLINPGIEELDLKDYLYDSILLSLPIQRIHPEDENGVSGCNPDMLKRFDVVDSDFDGLDDDEDFDDLDEEDEE